MAKDNGLILILGGGALAWYGYTQGWFSSLTSLFGTTTAVPTPLPVSTAPTCAAPNVLVNGVCTAPYVAPANPPTPITTPPAPSTSNLSSSGALAALALAAQAATEGLPNATTATLNADQWTYYYGHVPQFVPTVSGAAVNTGSLFDVNQVFFPNGRPANTADYTQYTAAQFIAALQNAGTSWSGLSGLGQAGFTRRIPVPMLVRPAYGNRKYTTADLRRAGRR